jgi:hypothetical protein
MGAKVGGERNEVGMREEMAKIVRPGTQRFAGLVTITDGSKGNKVGIFK